MLRFREFGLYFDSANDGGSGSGSGGQGSGAAGLGAGTTPTDAGSSGGGGGTAPNAGGNAWGTYLESLSGDRRTQISELFDNESDDLKAYLASVPQAERDRVVDLFGGSIRGLKASLASVRRERREDRDSMQRQIETLNGQLGENADAKATLETLQRDLVEANDRSEFAFEAAEQGIRSFDLAWRAIRPEWDDLTDRRGRLKWDEIKERWPELFPQPTPTTRPVPPGDGGSGTGSGRVPSDAPVDDMNSRIRRAYRGGGRY